MKQVTHHIFLLPALALSSVGVCVFMIAFVALYGMTWYSFVLYPVFVYALHMCMNCVHLASHRQISRNTYLNACVGYLCAQISFLSFTEFKITHLMHHAHPTDPVRDPDYSISQEVPLFAIPFFIWKKDVFFIQSALKGKKGFKLMPYLLERILQGVMIGLLFIGGSLVPLMYVLSALLITGFLNACFLFYFPHYKASFEEYLTTHKTGIPRLLSHCIAGSISLSRTFHHKHHENITRLDVYFPVEVTIVRSLQ